MTTPEEMIQLPDPRFVLLDQPTPLQRIPRMQERLNHPCLFVKRDDHMTLALGGNKVRSLEFWLGRARAEGADILLVGGGANSNLCRLTAAAAAMAGLDCVVLHNSAPTHAGRYESFLNSVLGAEVRFLGDIDEAGRAQALSAAAATLRNQGRTPYVVGDAIVGALGYVRAAAELLAQSRAAGIPLRHVFLPGSMGTTEAGFIFGNALLGHPFEVHLVSVEYDQAELAARIDRITRGLAEHTGLAREAVMDGHIHYHMDFLGEGYNKPTPACEQAILSFARMEGILLEHTYTGKTFAGFMAMVQEGLFPRDEGVCAVHTGGVPALFSQYEMFDSIDRLPR